MDRKLFVVKLAQGVDVSPEKIENIYVFCPLVAQVFVHGSQEHTSVVSFGYLFHFTVTSLITVI